MVVQIVAKIFFERVNPLIIPFDKLNETLKELIENGELEDLGRYSVTFELMSQRKIDSLPEHQGW